MKKRICIALVMLAGLILALSSGAAAEGNSMEGTPTPTQMPRQPTPPPNAAGKPAAKAKAGIVLPPAGAVLEEGQTSHTQTGWFSIIWGDSNQENVQVLYTLTDDAGQITYLKIDDKLAQSLGGVLSFNHKYVSVQGEKGETLAVQSGPEVLNVSSIRLAPAAGAHAMGGDANPAISGNTKWISIMCRFSDISTQPKNLAYFQGMYGNGSAKPGLDHYWRELSYSAITLTGSGASGWFVLPHPENYYNPSDTSGGTNLSNLANDCIAAADPSVNFSTYFGINMMFNSDFDNGWAWGGGWYANLDGATKTWAINWEPTWGYTDITALEHEMGHGYGLPHSSGNQGAVYDNSWDIMSNDWYNCSADTDSTYGCLGQHTISYHKDLLGWIASAKKYTAGPNTNATITLERLALPQTSNYLMAQIPINGSTTHFYTAEARQLTGYDIRVPGAAVVIHKVDTTLGIPAHVVDTDWNGNTVTGGVAWTAGTTFTDSANHITISILSATATGFQIRITTPPIWTISGYVTDGDGSGLSGVTMSGLPDNPLTDSNGFYTDSVPNGWSGTVTPTKAGSSFSNDSTTYSAVQADQTNQNYSASCISGMCVQVTDSGGNVVSNANVAAFTDLAGYPYWWTNTDGSGGAVLSLSPGTYTLVVSSQNANFVVVKSASSPGYVFIDPTGTVQVTVNAKKLDGSALQNAGISANVSPYGPGLFGTTNSAGTFVGWVTPGLTYSFSAWGWNDLYMLGKPGVSVPSATTVNLYAASMSTGQLTVHLDNNSSAYFLPYSQLSQNSTAGFNISDGAVFTLSTMNYFDRFWFFRDVGSNTWEYSVYKSLSISTGNQTLTTGGHFSAASQVDAASYEPGATVAMTDIFNDAHGNSLDAIWEITGGSPPSPSPVQTIQSGSKQAAGAASGSISPQASIAITPHLVVTDPDSNTIFDDQNWGDWNGNSFTLPGPAIDGDYHVDLSVDSGPNNGLISAGTTFTAHPHILALGQPGTSFRYLQSFGVNGTPYFADNTHLNYPWGVATNGTDVLIGEYWGRRVLTYTSTGGFVGSLGQAGINFSDGGMQGIFAMAVDSSGNTWVADTDAGQVHQLDSSGNFTGNFLEGTFSHPAGIAFDSSGNVYISDGGAFWSDDQNHQVVWVFDSSGNSLSTIGVVDTAGSDNGYFHGPQHIAIYGNMLYVADGGNERVQIFDISDPSNPAYSATIGISGTGGDDSTHLEHPTGVAVDASHIYVADRFNARVQVFSRSSHAYLATIGGSVGTGNDQFNNPSDVAVDSNGNIYVADFANSRVQQFNSSYVYQRTYGTSGVPYLTDNTHFNSPSGVAVASDGSLYITEDNGHRLIKLNGAGVPEWVIGLAGVKGDFIPTTNANFNNPNDVVLDSSGRVYVADQWHGRVQIFDSNGSFITTLGSGAGNFDFYDPAGLAIGPNGFIYVADSARSRVQIFDASRNYVATLGQTDAAGSDNSHFNGPQDVAVDSDGQIYVADTYNHRVQVFNSSRTYLRTLGTNGECWNQFSHFCGPNHLVVDSSNRLYVADTGNNRVQVFDASGGYLTTVGGNWGSQSAQFRNPYGLAVDQAGNLYVADHDNHRIQEYALGVPGWVQSNLNGFGDLQNAIILSLSVFNGQLYAGTHNYSGNGAQLWQSSDGQNWSNVMANGFGNGSNNGIDHLFEFNGNLYAGTWADDTNGGEAWRSPDGTSWEKVVSSGFGDTTQAEVFHFSSFNNQLYASTWSYSGSKGGEVWRSPTGNSGDWAKVVEDGFGDSDNQSESASIVFGNELYLGTFNTANGSQIWRSVTGNDGDWNNVDPAGFGDGAHNGAVASFATFNDSLYASTSNCDEGGQVWRSENGTNWEKMVDAGFGDTNNCSIDNLIVYGGYLYGSTNNHPWNEDHTGIEIWRTEDGSHWEQVNTDGFGDTNNLSGYWSNSMAIFDNHLFFGTRNYANGGEVWQLLSQESLIQIFLPLIIR